MNEIKKRHISDHDAQIVAGTGTALVKVGLSAVALVASGPEASMGVYAAYELSGVVLEGQRQRLADFAKRFTGCTAKVPAETQDRIREQLGTDAGSRLFEAAWHQAAQEVDPEKLDFIAALLKNSLSSEVLKEHHARWLLKNLNELDTVQIVILKSFAQRPEDQDAFREHHVGIFENAKHPQPPKFVASRRYESFLYGWIPRTEEDRATEERDRAEIKKEREAFDAKLPYAQEQYELARERHALYQSRVHNLVEKGLLGVTRRPPPFGEQVDQILEALTPLGTALLKIIDAADHFMWGQGEQVNTVEAIQQSLIDIELSSQKKHKAFMNDLSNLR